MIPQDTGIRMAASVPLLVLLLVGPARAQSGEGVVFGRVTEAVSGRPLTAANVVLEGTVLGTLTDRNGEYRIPRVAAGAYRLRVTVIGYSPRLLDVRLAAGEQLRVDAVLELAPLPMPDMVVTAGGQQQQAERAPAATSILSGRQVTDRAASSLETVLPLVTGVTMVEDQIGIRGSTGYNRGAGGRVLLLLDGVPGLGGDTGNVRWDTFPPQVVERVEVVRGPSSSLYGSSAMGGVVNVITASAHDPEVGGVRLRRSLYAQPFYEEYRFGDGTSGSTSLDLTRTFPLGRLGMLASASYTHDEGFRQNGWSRAGHLLLKLEGAQQMQDRWHLTLLGAREDRGHFIEWRGVNDPYEVTAVALGDWLRSDKVVLSGGYRRLLGPSSYLQLQPHIFGVAWRDHFHDSDHRATTVRSALDAQFVHDSGSGILTVGGMAALTTVDATIYGEHQVAEGALYAQREVEFSDRLLLNAGARFDLHATDATDLRSVLSPRASLVYSLSDPVALRLLVGRGFRAPSVAETFAATSTTGFEVIPNLALTPESAWTVEAGATWTPAPIIRMEGALFESRYQEMIEPTILQPSGDIQFQNVRKARLAGAEASLFAALPSGALRGGITYIWLRAEEVGPGRPLPYRRPRQGSVQLEGRVGSLRAGLDWLFGATMDTTVAYPFERRNPLRRLEARLSLELPARLRLSLHVRNLTDYYYTDIERNLTAPREYVLQLERGWSP